MSNFVGKVVIGTMVYSTVSFMMTKIFLFFSMYH